MDGTPGPGRPAPELRSRAAAAIREHANHYATLFERAERLRKRAERLESEGTPSDTARNKAERAEREVASELSNLRAEFLGSAGSTDTGITEKGFAFDQEVNALYPSLELP